MSGFDTNKLEQLLRAREWDEARAMLEQALAAPLSYEEKGAAYTAFIATYLRVMNRIYEEYDMALSDAISTLKTIDREEQIASEEIDLARVKGDIRRLTRQR